MQERILNAGCGSDTAYGTHFIDKHPTSKRVKKCDIDRDRFPFPSDYFDEVYSHSSFEHLRNPLNFIEESHRVLKTGGRIVIFTDNAGFFGLITDAHHGGYERSGASVKDDHHYALFTPYHLGRWLESAGFRKISVKYMKGSEWAANIPGIIHKRLYPHIEAIGIK